MVVTRILLLRISGGLVKVISSFSVKIQLIFQRFFIDFDSYEKEAPKMKDWRFFSWESDYTEARIRYTDLCDEIYTFCEIPLFHCPDLVIEPEDNAARIRIYEEVSIKNKNYHCLSNYIITNYFSRPREANMRMVTT